jgi:methyltransferase (TIGR00027 family)
VVIRTCIIDDFIREALGLPRDERMAKGRADGSASNATSGASSSTKVGGNGSGGGIAAAAATAAATIAGTSLIAGGEAVDTVLNLGAGLDTRPYRMELPESLLWIEADYPHMIEYKEERLAKERPRCRLERVKIDLADAAARQRMLAQVDARAKKVLVLTEGVVPYLDEEQVASLADDLRAMQHARHWVLDYFSPEVVKYRGRNGMHRHMQNAPFKFAPEDWQRFFERHGWQQKEMRYYAEEAQRLKRQLELPWLMRTMFRVRGILISKARREAFMKIAGYAMMEPTDAA